MLGLGGVGVLTAQQNSIFTALPVISLSRTHTHTHRNTEQAGNAFYMAVVRHEDHCGFTDSWTHMMGGETSGGVPLVSLSPVLHRKRVHTHTSFTPEYSTLSPEKRKHSLSPSPSLSYSHSPSLSPCPVPSPSYSSNPSLSQYHLLSWHAFL